MTNDDQMLPHQGSYWQDHAGVPWAEPRSGAEPTQVTANPYTASHYPYVVAPNMAPTKPVRNRRPVGVVVAGAAGILLLGGGAAYAANAYAKNEVCSAVKDNNSSIFDDKANDSESTADDVAEMESVKNKLENASRMLVFDNKLKGAVDGFASDIDRILSLKRANDANPAEAVSDFAEILSLIGSVNTHARAAQEACGLPATGIFGK